MNKINENKILAISEDGLEVEERLYKAIEPIINEPNIDGKTTLMIAVANNLKECTEMLIKHGADVNARGSNGYTALFFAVAKTQKNVQNCLLSMVQM